MTIPLHLKRKLFKKWFFSPNIIKTHQVLKRRSIKKRRERKFIEKKKDKKEEEKEKLQESLQIKGNLIFWEEKNTSTSKISFLMWFHFLPLHHTISKILFKIIEKVFLALFGPSFTHELHIFSL
jgi:hypothetical protein